MTDDLRPPFRQQFDNARDPYTARNALGIAGTGAGLITKAIHGRQIALVIGPITMYFMSQ